MREATAETYFTYESLGDIISETRAWYNALGLRMGSSLYGVVKASDGITGLVHAIAKTLKTQLVSKKVRIAVEDIPSIAYITLDSSQTIVHVGSWLYSRKKMEAWNPIVKTLNDADLLVFTLGLINGAVALDMMAQISARRRKETIDDVKQLLYSKYERNKNPSSSGRLYIKKSAENFTGRLDNVSIDERFVYISASIYDLLMIKVCVTEHRRGASWAAFPVLLFRAFFDDEFARQAKTNIEKEDTLDTLVDCVSALKCFSSESAKILDVTSSVGLNLVKALLAGTVAEYDNTAFTAESVITNEMAGAYLKELAESWRDAIKEEKNQKKQKSESQKQQGDGDGDGDGENNESESENEKQENDTGENDEKDGNQEQRTSSYVKGIAPTDASTPVNEDEASKQRKETKSGTKSPQDGDEFDTSTLARSPNQMARVGKGEPKEWLEHFMKLAFSGKIEYNQSAHEVPAPLVFKSMDDYLERVASDTGYTSVEQLKNAHSGYQESFRENVLTVFNSIDKTSLKNLFMERTMDIEKSQPARSGISLISTRIANIFTDEKIFSPLPDSETERDSEVIILVDASGSMMYRGLSVVDKDGCKRVMPIYDGVVGAAYALAEGFRAANVECTVFAHSTFGSDDGVHVVKINDQYSLNQKNDFINAGYMQNRNNGDGYAIEEVAQFFGQGGKPVGRTLIVLSDGQPAFHGYGSTRNGDKHTRKTADELREQGINVYSISLVEHVVNDNNYIYGEQYNFFPVDKLGGGVVSLAPMLKRIVEIVAKTSVRSANNVLTQG